MNAARLLPVVFGILVLKAGRRDPARKLYRDGFGLVTDKVVILRNTISPAGCLAAFLLACWPLSVCGSVFSDVVNLSPTTPFGGPSISYTQPSHNGTGLWVTVTRDDSTPPLVTIAPVTYTVGIPFSWYVASENDVFDTSDVRSMTPFVANWGIATPIQVATGIPFFLASWAGNQFDYQANSPVINPTDTYTWGKFVVSDDGNVPELFVLSSAMAYYGIVVGQPIAVPEPSTVFSLAAGLVFGGWHVLRGGRKRKTLGISRSTVALLLATFSVIGGTAHAQPAIDMVTVGDPGNTADTNPAGYGAVADSFQIMKYEFTNQQYTDFLNSVDPDGNSQLGVYNRNMSNLPQGGISLIFGNASGSKYAVKTNMGDKPVNYVSWFAAARVSNWLMNGATGTSSTETGAYTLVGGQTSGNAPAVNSGATVYIPTENQWYKAAYYKGGSTNAGYWDYATQSDTTPTAVTAGSTGIGSSGSTGNFANYNRGADWGSPLQDGNVTTVGTNGGASPYGVFDMSGNVWEWNDLTGAAGSYRGFRGGDYFDPNASTLSSSYRFTYYPSGDYDFGSGFRLASPVALPEPSTYAMALAGLACGGFSMWQRRKRVALPIEPLVKTNMASLLPRCVKASYALAMSLAASRLYVRVLAGLIVAAAASGSSMGNSVPVVTPFPVDGTDSRAWGVSGDGSVIVGQYGWPTTDPPVKAFRWTLGGSVEFLSTLPDYSSAQAVRVSDNGAVIAGRTYNEPYEPTRAVRWTAAGPQNLGILSGSGTNSSAWGLSGDGTVVVGRSWGDSLSSSRAFRWTESSGMQSLGSLSPDQASSASAVSGDGSVIVGEADLPPCMEPVSIIRVALPRDRPCPLAEA